jgi:sodium-dependent dicarboxylate transporter 2/3/5
MERVATAPDVLTETPGATGTRTTGRGAEEAEFRWPADRPEEALGTAPRQRLVKRRGTRVWVAVLGVLLGAAVHVAPLPTGLEPAGKASFAVFVVCVALWVTHVLPIGVTGLLAVALLGLLGGLEFSDAYAAFGNSAVFFILSVFILAGAVIHSGLSKRLALVFLKRFQQGPYTLAAGIMVTGAFLTMWMPAQATSAMLFPITFEIAQAAKLRKGASAYGRVLFLCLAWGAMIGSNASFLGSARAPLALGLLEESFGTSITFAEWVRAALPMVVIGLLLGFVVLRVLFRPERVDLGKARSVISEGVASLGPLGVREVRAALVMLATIVCWIFLGGALDRAAIAVLGVVAMFALGVLRWGDLEGYVQWGIVLMYGGAIAVGVAIDRSGAATWLLDGLLDGARPPAFVALIALVLLAVVLSEFMSNTAAVAVLMPIGFGMGVPLGLTPAAVVLATSFAAGLAFTLPISSAPNTIAYASGYVSMRNMVVAGSVMTVAQILLLFLLMWLYWPQIGLI